MAENTDNAVWVRHDESGSLQYVGILAVEELGDGYTVVKGPDDPTPVGVKGRVAKARKDHEAFREEMSDPDPTDG